VLRFRVSAVLSFCAAAACLPSAEWGPPQSAYTERCVDGACADGQSCVGGLCLRPEAAGDDYVPGLRCGDGVQQRWEPCDDGNTADIDGCVSGCRLARCGDGFLRQNVPPNDSAYETCDDGNDDDGDDCLNDCRVARCGDGVLRLDLAEGIEGFEVCDDGNRYDGDACVACRLAYCGDGLVQDEVEGCDDGNQELTDGCLNDCQVAYCGDGQRRTDRQPQDPGYEECDDGNDQPEDECGNDCYRNVSFDGLGTSAADLGHSCAQIKASNPAARDGLFWIDPDAARPVPPMQVRCDMTTAGGGFTRLALIYHQMILWNAWSEGLLGQTESNEPFGVPFSVLRRPAQELEFFFVRDGQRLDVIFSGVKAQAWDPLMTATSFDASLTHELLGGEPQACQADLVHAEAHWNWSVASQDGCAALGAMGAVLMGDSEGDLVEAATRFQAPGEPEPVAFEALEVWLR
jgi:cysteine-rich repeat protein